MTGDTEQLTGEASEDGAVGGATPPPQVQQVRGPPGRLATGEQPRCPDRVKVACLCPVAVLRWASLAAGNQSEASGGALAAAPEPGLSQDGRGLSTEGGGEDTLFVHLRDNMDAIREFWRGLGQQIPTPDLCTMEGESSGRGHDGRTETLSFRPFCCPLVYFSCC